MVNREYPGMRCVTRRSMLHTGMALVTAACAPAHPQLGETDDGPFKTPAEPANRPMGIGKGIRSGRVAWANRPKAAAWDGKTGNWWDDSATDGKLVAEMLAADV